MIFENSVVLTQPIVQQVYWRKFDRVERQQKRQLEKEAEEQEKLDLQLLEAKRQQRKLNFLVRIRFWISSKTIDDKAQVH